MPAEQMPGGVEEVHGGHTGHYDQLISLDPLQEAGLEVKHEVQPDELPRRR